VTNGHDYLENPVAGKVLQIRYKDRELFVKAVKRENFERKLALKETYKANTVVTTKESVGSETVLGYPGPHKQYKNDCFYDCSTFFADNTFMAETKSREAPVYVIPEDEVLYEESDYGPREQSFEAGIAIGYSEAGEKEGDKILRLNVASVETPRWVRQNGLPGNVTVTKDTLSVKSGAAILTLFAQNPLEYQFTEKGRTGILAGTLVLLKEKAVIKTAAMVEYCQYNFGDKLFYIRKLDRDSHKENILEWEKHFIVYDPQSDNIIYNPSDEAGKEIEEMIRKARPSTGRDWTKNELTVFKRTIFCKHPLEWDKTKYDSALIKNRMCLGDEDRHKILREKAEKMDIWSSIKDNEAIKQTTNNLWFAHPIYFLNHMNKAGLLRQPVEDRIKMGAANIKDVLPDDGPCFMRVLQGGVSSWVGINMTEEQIRNSIRALKSVAIRNDWFVEKPVDVIYNALEIYGFKKSDFLIDLYMYSKPDFILSEEQGFIFTIIPIVYLDKAMVSTKPDHWQEGDSECNFIWDPYWSTQVKRPYRILRSGNNSPRWITVKKR
jgi:hypothetical protein